MIECTTGTHTGARFALRYHTGLDEMTLGAIVTRTIFHIAIPETNLPHCQEPQPGHIPMTCMGI